MQALSRLVIALAISLALTLSADAATAAAELVPPGLSGANQYTETLPGPGGNEPTGSAGGKHSQSPKRALGQSNAERLEALGPEGRAAARLAAAGAPAKVDTPGPGKATKAGGASSGLNQVLGSLTGTDDSGGMNGWLLLLIAALAVAAAAYWIRRRKSTDGHS